MLHPHDLRHMDGVTGQHLRRLLSGIFMDKGMMDIESHNAPGIPDGPELIVRQIAGHGTQGAAIGMGRNHRSVGHGDHIPEPRVVEVGDIQEHPPLFHPPDDLPPRRGQSPVRTSPDAGGQLVLLIPCQCTQAGAQRCIAVNPRGIVPNGFHPLNAQKGIHLPGRPGLFRFAAGTNHAQPGAFRQFRRGLPEHPLRPGRRGIRTGDLLPKRLRRSGGPHRQNQSLDVPPAQAVQMVPFQHPALPCQTSTGYIIEKIGMSVKNHVRSFTLPKYRLPECPGRYQSHSQKYPPA